MITPAAYFKLKFDVEPEENSKNDQSMLAWIRVIQRGTLVHATEIVAKTDQTPPVMPSEVVARATRAIMDEMESI